mgnify:CR=1 FL=1
MGLHTKFDKWDLIGITQVGNLWRNGEVKTWSELQEEFHLVNTEKYKYLQVRHALQSAIVRGKEVPEASPLEMRLLGEPITEKAISTTYKKILHNMPDMLLKVWERWARDVTELSDEEWTPLER